MPQAVGRLNVAPLRTVRQPTLLLKSPIGSTSLARASGRLKVSLSTKFLRCGSIGAFIPLMTCYVCVYQWVVEPTCPFFVRILRALSSYPGLTARHGWRGLFCGTGRTWA